MSKNDEQLIRRFLQDNRQEVADNGFSRRVMRRLPVRPKVVSDVLTAVCVVLSGILLYVFDGLNLILASLQEVLPHPDLNAITNINLQTWLPLLVVVAILGIQKAIAVAE